MSTDKHCVLEAEYVVGSIALGEALGKIWPVYARCLRLLRVDVDLNI